MPTDLTLLPVVEEGRRAAQDGAAVRDCPYSAISDRTKALSWLGGFRYGQTAEGATPAPPWESVDSESVAKADRAQ